MKYRKKSVIIEAWEFSKITFPFLLPDEILDLVTFDNEDKTLYVDAILGTEIAQHGDFIVKNEVGHITVLTSEEFKQTYEEVWD